MHFASWLILVCKKELKSMFPNLRKRRILKKSAQSPIKGGINFTNPKNSSLIVIIIVSTIIFLLLSLTILSPIEPPKAKVFLSFILILIWAGIILYIYLKQKAAKLYPTETSTSKKNE